MSAITNLSAEAMAAAIRRGELTARAVLEAHLARIERLDPELGAFRTLLAQSARAEADHIDQHRDELSGRPLLGVPVAIKDTMDVRGVPSRLGTGSAQPPATDDCEVVRRLRGAGAVIVGKTNLPELAAWPFTSSSSWGRTSNPWDTALDPGGSSGGSAVAVASRMCALALGDDLGGSIRVPAANMGLFGLKPQADRVSTLPHVARIQGLGTYGPLARTVVDAGIALDVLSACDGFAIAARAPEGAPRLRIGFSIDAPIGVMLSKSAREGLDRARLAFTSLGHSVETVRVRYGPLLPIAFFLRYFGGLADEYAALVEPHGTEPRTRHLARLGRLVPRAALRWAKGEGGRQWSRLAALFDRIDVLVTPVLTGPPSPSDFWGERGLVSTLRAVAQHSPYAALANMTGQPACALPMGTDERGLPVAVQVLARPSEERTLLSLAAEVEKAHPFPTLVDDDDQPSRVVTSNRGGPGNGRRDHAEHPGERA
ncbi:MAG: amidase [Polyangiaceae bacterium]|nr:amidase [Polyangiaceae bacterium]